MDSFAASNARVKDSHTELNMKRAKRMSGRLPPSDPDFEREKYSKDEFIELLLFEIKELKSSIASKDEKISSLLLKSNSSSKSFGLVSENGLNHHDTIDEVPQRSARRKLEQLSKTESTEKTQEDPRRNSIASITSNGPIDISDGMPLSSTFRSELSAALGIKDTYTSSPSPQPDFTSKYQTDLLATQRSPHGAEYEKFSDNEVSLANDVENSDGETKNDESVNTDQVEHENIPPRDNLASRKGNLPPVNSYRSRIKLPTTIKQPDLTSSVEDLQTDTNSSSVSQAVETMSQDDPFDRQRNNEQATPHSQEVFGQSNGRFQTRSEGGARLSEDSHSHLNSPFTESLPILTATPTTSSNFDVLRTPNTQMIASNDSLTGSRRPSAQTPGSSFHVLPTPKADDDVDLFIKPEEFQTIRINVVSTITVNAKKLDDPNCTFSINDKESGKEMWRIRKSYSQLLMFDNDIRPVVEFFGLPPLPEKSSFSSTTPLKVDSRRVSLQDYFNTIFVMPHIPRLVLMQLCRFLSLDFVNPLDDFRTGSRKEGFLIRRYKGLGTTWKVRWCQVDGPALEIYDSPGGSLLEQIKLSGSQIGRQSSDSVAEERGYRHAFLILENTKSSKLSSSLPKHFFCAESDSERDEWVAAMVEFTENDPLSSQDDVNNHLDIDTKRTGDILYDDGEASGRHLSGIGSNFGQLSLESDNATQNLDDSTKEIKKAKKKSRFTFRNRASILSDAQQSQQDKQIFANSLPNELPMQAYLDQMRLTDEPARIIFGRNLDEAFELSNHQYNGRRVPSVCYRCLDFLSKTGAVYEEGIFRLSGSASSIRQLKEKFNSKHDVDLFESELRPDMHTVAGLLKSYLRELPDPIFGGQAYSELQNLVAKSGTTNSSTVLMMRDFIKNTRNVNRVHYDFCVSIFGFLRLVISKSSTNKMNLKNVCIVFVPTLNMSTDILSACLTDFDCIFGNAEPIPDSDRQVLDLQIPTF